MRILVSALNFPPEATGGAVTTGGRVRYLASQGHRVDVIAGFPHYPEWRVREGYRGRVAMRETVDGADVRRRWHYVPTSQNALGRSLLEATFALTAVPSALVAPRPDVVLSVVPAVSAGLAGVVAAARFRAPHGVFVLDLAGRSAEQSGMAGGRLVRRAAEPLEGAVLRRATRVAVITEGFRAPIEEMGVSPDRIDLVTDWKQTEAPTLPRDEVRRRVGLPLDAPLLLHTGNMGYKQGLEYAVEMAALAASELPALRLVLVGDGNQRTMLEERVRARALSNVTFMPLQARELYASLLGAADVLLLNQRASVVEMSLPSKLIDYYASGRPVIAAVHQDSEAARDIARSGGGMVVPPEDPRALLDGVRALLDAPEVAAGLGARAQAYVRDRNSPQALAAAADGFVARLVETHARDRARDRGR